MSLDPRLTLRIALHLHQDGGALYLWYGLTKNVAVVAGSSFVSNTASVTAGAILPYDLDLELSNSYFEGNVALDEFFQTMAVVEVVGGGSSCSAGQFGECTELGPNTGGAHSCVIDFCKVWYGYGTTTSATAPNTLAPSHTHTYY